MIKSVGIDLAGSGEHKVRCLDEAGQMCDGLSFQPTPEGLSKLEERIFSDGSNPVIVFEPTGLSWLMVAIYLKARHPDCHLVRVQARKVVALRRYLRRSSKSDKIDALTLAKMPFIDSEQLEEIYLPPAKIYAIQRLARQRKRLECEIGSRKKRIGSIVDGYLPGMRQAFSNPWSAHARAFLRSCLNPLEVVHSGEKALHAFLTKARRQGKADRVESHLVYLACQDAATLYKLSSPVGTIDEDFFAALQDEISRELRLMEMAEAESESIANRLEQLYHELHPSDNLRTIPGVGEHTAPILLAVVGDPARFRSQSAFANYTGVVPAAKQSADAEAKGLRMTKAGPAIMKWSLYQSGQIGRRFDPQLAWLYYREMVHHGKNHKQAMGAVMSHMGARVLAVLREDKPYELRDVEGKPITSEEARRLILLNYQVPEHIKRERRRRKQVTDSPTRSGRRKREMVAHRTNEAATAPQPVEVYAHLPTASLAESN
jgi:transposase